MAERKISRLRPPPLAMAGILVIGVGAAACGALAATDTGLYTWLGLTAPGSAHRVLLPALRAVAELAGGVAVGSALFAAFVAPPRTPAALDVDGYLAMRRAGWAAGTAGSAALALAPFVAADLTGSSVPGVFGAGWWTVFIALEEPVAWLLSGSGFLVTAAVCLGALSWRTAPTMLATAVASVLPPAVVGQVATGAGHDWATDASIVQTLAAAVTTGILVSLLVHLRRGGPHREVIARRVARVLHMTWPLLLISGVVLAAVFAGTQPLSSTSWGVVTVVRLSALVATGVTGALLWRAGRAGMAAGVMLAGSLTATLLSVVLGRWTPPRFLEGTDTTGDILIGYDLSAPATAARLLLDWRFNLLIGTAAIVLAAGYLLAVRRMARRGDAWPAGRTWAWLAGCTVVLLATSSGVGRYAAGVFSIHMVGHMALNMLAPALLALAGPVTLALRVLRPAGRGQPPGAREWLAGALASPTARRLTHPLPVLVLFVGSFYALYFTGLFDVALDYHWGHQLMNVHFVAVGYLFFWPLVGTDPAPTRLPHLGRLAVLLASMPFHAFFGVALMSTSTVLGAEFYRRLALPWVPDLLHDQHVGGGVAWATGELPMLLVILALLVRWVRDDEREAARHDRRAEIDGDSELHAYNEMLARLAGSERSGAP